MSDDRRGRFEREAIVHLGALYNAACRLTRHEDKARDLTQDTMLRAYRSFDGFRPGTNARAWLLTIMYSVFVNQYHRERREPMLVTMEQLEARHAHEPVAEESAIDPIDGVWTEPEIAAALAELPEPFRLTVLLVDVEELSYAEAADALGCEIGTVRSRLFRARRFLAASLARYARERRLIKPVVDSQ